MKFKIGDLCYFIMHSLTGNRDLGLCILTSQRPYGSMSYNVWLIKEGRFFEYAKEDELKKL